MAIGLVFLFLSLFLSLTFEILPLSALHCWIKIFEEVGPFRRQFSSSTLSYTSIWPCVKLQKVLVVQRNSIA